MSAVAEPTRAAPDRAHIDRAHIDRAHIDRAHIDRAHKARRSAWHPLQWPALVLVVLIRAYQLLISPMLGPTCRFYPSCSAYAVQALQRRGVVVGTWLTLKRLLRCHPWNPGGVDPVPAGPGGLAPGDA